MANVLLNYSPKTQNIHSKHYGFDLDIFECQEALILDLWNVEHAEKLSQSLHLRACEFLKSCQFIAVCNWAHLHKRQAMIARKVKNDLSQVGIVKQHQYLIVCGPDLWLEWTRNQLAPQGVMIPIIWRKNNLNTVGSAGCNLSGYRNIVILQFPIKATINDIEWTCLSHLWLRIFTYSYRGKSWNEFHVLNSFQGLWNEVRFINIFSCFHVFTFYGV